MRSYFSIIKRKHLEIEHCIRQLCEDFCDQADEELSENQKKLKSSEKIRIASEYGQGRISLYAIS
jgi:hypothetical protein